MWKDPGEKPRKLRLVSDTNFPFALVEALRRRGVEIKTAQELGAANLSDEELLGRVTKDGYLLITMDRDFWSDAKFPLHKAGGIIFIDGKDARISETDGFELLVVFLLSIGGGWTWGKFRASSERVHAKIIGVDGKKVVYEIKPFRPLVYAREVTESTV